MRVIRKTIEAVVETPERSKDTEPYSSLQDLLDDSRWTELLAALQQSPALARVQVQRLHRGERSLCTPLHLAVATPGLTFDVLDALATCHPAALEEGDSLLDQHPLHWALFFQPQRWIVHYLIQAAPSSLQHADRCERALPLHLALQVGLPDTDLIQDLLTAYPDALSVPTHRCWALHLAAAHPDTTLATFQLLLSHCQQVNQPDRQGKLPLHWACQAGHSWDILQALLPDASTKLEDDSGSTPCDHYQRCHGTTDSVVYWSLKQALRKRRRSFFKPRRSSVLPWNGCYG